MSVKEIWSRLVQAFKPTPSYKPPPPTKIIQPSMLRQVVWTRKRWMEVWDEADDR